MVRLTRAEYRQRVHGGWLGKLIGMAVGRLGEGVKDYVEAVARAPAPAGEGSDFQLVWLRALERVGPKLGPDDLIGVWLRHLEHGQGEYPYALASFRREVAPPVSGAFDNPFREGLGALARAELWGMVAPGDPERAAQYAYQDAILDHAGAGVEAAIWMAGMASAAFVESQVARLIEVGLALVPGEGRVARAVRDVVRWHGELAHWMRTREMLLRAYGSEEARDSAVCAGVIALSLLDGRGDFERTVVTAARCAWSTTSTCGAAGALLGLALGGGADTRGVAGVRLRRTGGGSSGEGGEGAAAEGARGEPGRAHLRGGGVGDPIGVCGPGAACGGGARGAEQAGRTRGLGTAAATGDGAICDLLSAGAGGDSR